MHSNPQSEKPNKATKINITLKGLMLKDLKQNVDDISAWIDSSSSDQHQALQNTNKLKEHIM